ncbi:hypothetical protein BC833DRAFT_604758 [Globomyces pollinis-pini]|nr:hypothetical protein BC833DRAFT_604758 [Globomyces pollinis-pini]
MLGWSLVVLVYHFCLFSNCHGQITIPINGRQFEIKNSYEFLRLPVDIYTSASKILADRNTYCAQFIPQQPAVGFLGAGSLYFTGNLAVQNTLRVSYEPRNLTNDFIIVNNLTQILKKGFNADREVSKHLDTIFQNGIVQFFVTNNDLNLRGVFDSSNSSTMFINTVITNSTTEWSTAQRYLQAKFDLFQIRNYSATQSALHLDLKITSRAIIRS